jgi:hypothetical protein
MSKNLNDFVKDNSKFIRLDDGESFEGTFKSFKVVSSQFDPEKETVVYKLAYLDGKESFWQTSSVRVAKLFSKFKGGEIVKITRHGKGNETKYEISSPDIKIEKEEIGPDDEVPPEWVKN